jgi:hypothetical protein
MSCPKCDYYRRKLSPLEDPAFTADFLLVQPVAWMRENQAVRKNSTQKLVSISASECFAEAFGYEPDHHDVMQMGRTLRALGWESTKQGGYTRYVKELEEFDSEHFTK